MCISITTILQTVNKIHTWISAWHNLLCISSAVSDCSCSFIQNNQLDASNIQHLYCHKILRVSGIFSAHHQELSAVRTAVGTFHAGFVTASKQSQVGTAFQPDSAWKRSQSLRETYQLPCVQQITLDDGQRRCPKHVEFYDNINVGYLMHLFGCFIQSLSWCKVTWT